LLWVHEASIDACLHPTLCFTRRHTRRQESPALSATNLWANVSLVVLPTCMDGAYRTNNGFWPLNSHDVRCAARRTVETNLHTCLCGSRCGLVQIFNRRSPKASKP